MSNTDLAAELRLTKGSISDILYGRVKQVSGPVVELLKIKFNVNPDWLLTGEGDMFLPGKGQASPAQQPPHIINHNGTDYGVIDGSADNFPEITRIEQIARTGWFRELSTDKKFIIAAIDEITDTEYLRDLKGALSFKVQGDRMKKEHPEKPLRQKGETG